MTRWFRRLLSQTFHGKDLMTEETLQALALDIARTRAALAEVFQEVSLAMQALDLIQARCSQALGTGQLPQVPVVHAPSPLEDTQIRSTTLAPRTLTRDSRQRESPGQAVGG